MVTDLNACDSKGETQVRVKTSQQRTNVNKMVNRALAAGKRREYEERNMEVSGT